MSLVQDALQEINGTRFALYCQPIRQAHDRNIKGDRPAPRMGEVLLRIKKDDLVLTAGDFIDSLASDGELMHRVDRWVLGAIAQRMKVENNLDFRYTVNLDSSTLRHPSFLPYFCQTFSGTTPQKMLALELTERRDFDADATRILWHLRDMCPIILDDLGSRYSALIYLQRMPISWVKIEGEIILSVLENHKSWAIAGGLMAIAQDLGLTCIAECVEDDALWAAVLELKRKYAPRLDLWVQGWEIGRPRELT